MRAGLPCPELLSSRTLSEKNKHNEGASISCTVEIDGEEHDARIVFGMALPSQLFFQLLVHDKRKTVAPPGPVEITFRNSNEAHEFVGKIVAWMGKH